MFLAGQLFATRPCAPVTTTGTARSPARADSPTAPPHRASRCAWRIKNGKVLVKGKMNKDSEFTFKKPSGD
jgi:hypothetical protein